MNINYGNDGIGIGGMDVMIKKGTKVKVRPYKRYKDNPVLNEDIAVGTDEFGEYLQCQVMDITPCHGGKSKAGFFYARIHTNVPLAVDDMVTVKDFLYAQRKGNICVIAFTIEEQAPMENELIYEDDGYGF